MGVLFEKKKGGICSKRRSFPGDVAESFQKGFTADTRLPVEKKKGSTIEK